MGLLFYNLNSFYLVTCVVIWLFHKVWQNVLVLVFSLSALFWQWVVLHLKPRLKNRIELTSLFYTHTLSMWPSYCIPDVGDYCHVLHCDCWWKCVKSGHAGGYQRKVLLKSFLPFFFTLDAKLQCFRFEWSVLSNQIMFFSFSSNTVYSQRVILITVTLLKWHVRNISEVASFVLEWKGWRLWSY